MPHNAQSVTSTIKTNRNIGLAILIAAGVLAIIGGIYTIYNWWNVPSRHVATSPVAPLPLAPSASAPTAGLPPICAGAERDKEALQLGDNRISLSSYCFGGEWAPPLPCGRFKVWTDYRSDLEYYFESSNKIVLVRAGQSNMSLPYAPFRLRGVGEVIYLVERR